MAVEQGLRRQRSGEHTNHRPSAVGHTSLPGKMPAMPARIHRSGLTSARGGDSLRESESVANDTKRTTPFANHRERTRMKRDLDRLMAERDLTAFW